MLNFQHFPKKDDPHSLCLLGITCPKKHDYKMSNKSCFRAPFNRQHRKWAKTLLQSERKHLYYTY